MPTIPAPPKLPDSEAFLFELPFTNQEDSDSLSEADAMFGWAKKKLEQWRKDKAAASSSPSSNGNRDSLSPMVMPSASEQEQQKILNRLNVLALKLLESAKNKKPAASKDLDEAVRLYDEVYKTTKQWHPIARAALQHYRRL